MQSECRLEEALCGEGTLNCLQRQWRAASQGSPALSVFLGSLNASRASEHFIPFGGQRACQSIHLSYWFAVIICQTFPVREEISI